MEEFFGKTFYGNTISDWGISLLWIVGGIVLGKAMYWFISRVLKNITKRTKGKFDDLIVDMIEEPTSLASVLVFSWFALDRLHFTEDWHLFIGHVFYILITFNVAWLIARLVDSFIQEYVVPLAESTESTLDDQLLPILRKSLKALVWAMALIIGLDNAGYNIGALLAGMGIGGIALAMAAKDTVSNIFGGLTVFIDKPFAVKDRIVIDGIDGVVEEIGIRSTRIRNLNGRIVTIPNSGFASGQIENISSEPSRKISITLGLTYDIKPEKMQLAMSMLKDIVVQQQCAEDNVLVGFTGFGDFSLNISLIYYIKSGEDIFVTQSYINSEILKRFNEEGLEFAFPTQTIYTNPQK
jgi:MscS family membrane protein